MKTIFKTILIIPLLVIAYSCDDSTSIMFNDYYACIKDESGSSTSTITTKMSESYTATYYINLVSVLKENPVTVSYDIKAGDGLKEGVNYKIVTGGGSVTFDKGIFKKPLRIEFFPVAVDEEKDCTITITLTGSNDKSINLGYPGPSARYSSHTITVSNK